MIENLNNKRYRMIVKNKKSFLIDLDSHPLIWLFPICIYLFPLKGLETDKKITLKKVKVIKNGTFGGLVLLTSGFLIIFTRLIPTYVFTVQPLKNKEFLLSIVIIFLMIIILLYRKYLSKKMTYKEPVKSEVLLKIKVDKLLKENWKYLLGQFLSYALFVFIWFSTFMVFVKGGNPISLAISLGTFYLILIANFNIRINENIICYPKKEN